MSNTRKVKKPREFKITKGLIREAQEKGWSGGQLLAVAMQRGMPGAQNIVVTIPPSPHAVDPALRYGYEATPERTIPNT